MNHLSQICRNALLTTSLIICSYAHAQLSMLDDDGNEGYWGRTNYISEGGYSQKVRYKSLVIMSYKAADSTLSDKHIEYKETITVKDSLPLMDVKENGNGRVIEKTLYKYDAKGNMEQFTSYDSLGKISTDEGYKYNSLGKVSSFTTTSQLCTFTYNPKDTGKMVITTTTYAYDFAGNITQTSNDSAGVTTYNLIEQFDSKNRTILVKRFNHSRLESNQATAYDAKGNYTITTNSYYNSYMYSCNPNVNTTISKYDKDGNMLSSTSVVIANGVTTTTKSSSKYKFSKGKVISAVTTTEESGEFYSSKTIENMTYTYDEKGHLLKYETKGRSSSTTTTYKYNTKGRVTEEVVYGACIDKPSSMDTYSYYPNDTVLKEICYASFGYPYKTVTGYNERGEVIREFIRSYDNTIRLMEYKYEY
jgi:YD repeat-containing protein